jgi:hypothetical protein
VWRLSKHYHLFMKLRSLPVFFACAVLAGCAASRERDSIRSGILTTDLSQKSFLQVWGPPTRTSVVHSVDDITKASIAPFHGSFSSKDEKTYEIWNYDARKTTLVFEDHELTGWSTLETVQELAAHSR